MTPRVVVAIAALLMAGSSAAQAGPKEDAIDALMKCADIADKAARSDCFDAAIPQLRAAAQVPAPVAAVAPPPAAPATAPTAQAEASAPSSPGVAAAAPPPPAEQPQEDSSSGSGLFASINPFGADAPPSPQQMAYQGMGQEILPVAIGVARFGPSDAGGFEITLDNGQVWRERNEHYDIPPWRSDERNIVYIERGMLGGYNLYLRPFGKIYKVVRIK